MKIAVLLLFSATAFAQIDAKLAQSYFKEADLLCRHEGGRLWRVSLCGPMLFADPNTRSFVTSRPVRAAKLPDDINIANTAIDWEGLRWTMVQWPLPTDEKARGRLMMHELYHRIQNEIGLPAQEGSNEHLDTRDGRIWLQLEMRALARALQAAGKDREQAIADALAFRKERHRIFPKAAAAERALEDNEGLAEYTGTVAVSEPVAHAVSQLEQAPENPSFFRSFAYSTGSAYGLLLDDYDATWRKSMKPDSDMPERLASAAHIEPTPDVQIAAARYDGAALMAAEDKREAERVVRIAAIRKRFVEGPVLMFPNANIRIGFDPNSVVSVPDVGTYYPTMRVSADWGILEITNGAVIAENWSKLTVPSEEKWDLKLNTGWKMAPGQRLGDLVVVRESSPAK
jgi:hypothetical protein